MNKISLKIKKVNIKNGRVFKFYKDESLEEYTNEIRTEIINGIDDILKTDSDFSYVINKEEKLFWNNIRDKFIKFDEYYFNKKVNRLCKTITTLYSSKMFNTKFLYPIHEVKVG